MSLEFFFKSTVIDETGSPKTLTVVADVEGQVEVFDGDEKVNWEALPAADQIGINKKIEDELFMEDASDHWDSLNSEYLFGLVQDLNSSRHH